MVLGVFIGLCIITILLYCLIDEDDKYARICLISFILTVAVFVYGFFNGFIYHRYSEGTHQGIITAVDLEGTIVRHYKVYLKSYGYTNQSDETIYLLYDYETELAEELQNCIGKTVKLHYGFEGGYYKWNSCGTYHITSVEIVEEE